MKDLDALLRQPRVMLHDAVASAVASLVSAGQEKILFISRFKNFPGATQPRPHAFLVRAFAAAAEALGRPLRVLALRAGSKKSIDTDGIEAFRASKTAVVLCLSDSGCERLPRRPLQNPETPCGVKNSRIPSSLRVSRLRVHSLPCVSTGSSHRHQSCAALRSYPCPSRPKP